MSWIMCQISVSFSLSFTPDCTMQSSREGTRRPCSRNTLVSNSLDCNVMPLMINMQPIFAALTYSLSTSSCCSAPPFVGGFIESPGKSRANAMRFLSSRLKLPTARTMDLSTS